MNPVFWLVIVVAVIIVWSILSFAFEPIGRGVRKFIRHIFGKDDE